jgi:hypothetical protein
MTSLAIRASLAAGLALLAASALAGTPRQIPCALGEHGKITQVNAERVEARLDTADEGDIRYEYRAVLYNPHPWAAEVVPSLGLPQLREAAAPILLPPRTRTEVLIGWVPVSNPIRRGAPPEAAEVQRRLTLEACRILPPGGRAAPLPAGLAFFRT